MLHLLIILSFSLCTSKIHRILLKEGITIVIVESMHDKNNRTIDGQMNFHNKALKFAHVALLNM